MTGRAGQSSKVKRRLIFAALVLAGSGVLGAVLAGFILWVGLFNVAATSGHPWPVAMVLHYAMERSVALHAPDLPHPDLEEPGLILRGATHFASGCASCHGAPGQLASPIAQQMTPVPPGLYSAGRDYSPSQLFWIIKHGVKLTAMPGWPAQQRPDEIWAMVAFVKHLPLLNTGRYAQLSGWDGNASFLADMPPTAPGVTFNPVPCGRCHGADGDGRNGAAPPIAGFDAGKTISIMKRYRDGSLPSGFMQPVAAGLSDDQIEQAAQYYAALLPEVAQ